MRTLKYVAVCLAFITMFTGCNSSNDTNSAVETDTDVITETTVDFEIEANENAVFTVVNTGNSDSRFDEITDVEESTDDEGKYIALSEDTSVVVQSKSDLCTLVDMISSKIGIPDNTEYALISTERENHIGKHKYVLEKMVNNTLVSGEDIVVFCYNDTNRVSHIRFNSTGGD